MRTCTKCRVAKLPDAFALRRTERGTLQSWCRDCHKTHAAERYRRMTPEQMRRKRQADRATTTALRRRIWEHLRGRACVDCGQKDVLTLEFDHIGAKTGNVSDLVRNGSWSAVLIEIGKCEIRCANCHRRQTRARLTQRLTTGVRARRPGRGSNSRHTDSKSVALSTELPGLYDKGIGKDGIVCGRCRTVKPAGAFAWHDKHRGVRQPWCRDCHNAHKRAFYALNRATGIARVGRRRDAIASENAVRARGYLEVHPCVDCGETDPSILEFDHLRDKKHDVTRMIASGHLWSSVEREIAKCEIRCVNCHRRRTARQRGFADRKRGLAEDRASYGTGAAGPRPRAESNRRLRFRRPMLYPLSYGVVG